MMLGTVPPPTSSLTASSTMIPSMSNADLTLLDTATDIDSNNDDININNTAQVGKSGELAGGGLLRYIRR